MKKWFTLANISFWVFILPVLFLSPVQGDPIGEISPLYQNLIYRLSQDGFDPKFMMRVLTDSRVELFPSFMTISLGSVETKDIYSQFLTHASISLAKSFLYENRVFLIKVERDLHVDKEVIVAILLVESRFGENIGKYRVLPTLVSRTLMDDQDNVQKNYELLKEMDPEISFKWLEGVAKRRAAWGYHELKSFLKIIQAEEIDPLEVYGSSAGALGMAQFIPSSYLTFAISQKGLAHWLQSREEAISSIGNYLKSHGWGKGLSLHKKRQVLWHYNRSKPYVETILKVAQKIKN